MTLREPNHLIWNDRPPESDKEAVAEINASLEQLNGLRAVEINVSGPFARSKIAWKLVTYQHALLHRIVALIGGAAVAWNARCTLSAALSARAFMETMAVMAALESRVSRFLAEEDWGGLDGLAQQGIFARQLGDNIRDGLGNYVQARRFDALNALDFRNVFGLFFIFHNQMNI
jgi:hypothetical protein